MAAPEYFRSPQQLLEELAIEDPQDLDVEAIAHHCGAMIVYKRLTGCAARITGKGDRAIITIDSGSPRARQRFSAGHELGHWMYDRGKLSFSCEENKLIREWSRTNPEAAANRYASDLLLPVPLFKPRAYAYKAIDFNAVRKLATTFETSLTATAIRLVEHGPLPAAVICLKGGEIGSIEGRIFLRVSFRVKLPPKTVTRPTSWRTRKGNDPARCQRRRGSNTGAPRIVGYRSTQSKSGTASFSRYSGGKVKPNRC